jgi:hypothetical protein
VTDLRWKLLGITWITKRRMNSLASSVIVALRCLSGMSLQQSRLEAKRPRCGHGGAAAFDPKRNFLLPSRIPRCCDGCDDICTMRRGPTLTSLSTPAPDQAAGLMF